MATSESRLRAVLGDEQPLDASTADWAAGYGIVSPDVARYADVLRGMPDAVSLAMRNIAALEGIELADADTATLLMLQLRLQRPQQVLEVGTGLGYLTLHLGRAAPHDCTVTSIDDDPLRQAQAHAFLERDERDGVLELRLGDPLRVLREMDMRRSWDMVVLSDPHGARLDVLDAVAELMSPDALLAIPWALRGGRVADAMQEWSSEQPEVEAQRILNRCVASDPRFRDLTLLPVGDGLLLARRHVA